MPNNSAAGNESHTPFSPKILGNSSTATIMNTKVRIADMIADTFPSYNAVNIAEPYFEMPINKALKSNILKPCTAKSKTCVPGGEKTDTRLPVISCPNMNTTIENRPMDFKLILWIFFKRWWSPFP